MVERTSNRMAPRAFIKENEKRYLPVRVLEEMRMPLEDVLKSS
jgi:hypothetical protein